MRIAIVATVLALAALFAAAASADLIAATEVYAPETGNNTLDIALIDTATGQHLSLPAAVNTTTADELHPSVTPDGKRMVFERHDFVNHVVHIIVVDLSTGQQAELFNAFESGQFSPVTPTITPDGKTVISGAAWQPSGALFVPTWLGTDISSFPNGPFPHTVRQQSNLPFPDPGTTLDPSFDPAVGVHGITALTLERSRNPPVPDGVLVSDSGKNTNVFDNGHSVDSPAYSSAAGVLLLQRRSAEPEVDLAYRTLTANGVPNGSTFLLPGVNSANSAELHPAFTTDGRYIAYEHQHFTAVGNGVFDPGDIHVLVYDTGTQLILDPTGPDVGDFEFGNPDEGGVSLYQTFVFKGIQLFGGLHPVVQFTLITPSGVGILVQRIIGHHMLLGRRMPKLHKVGRVPFGPFHRGKHRVHWNLRVNGHKLRPGRYLVTPRALTKQGVVRELGKPHILRVR